VHSIASSISSSKSGTSEAREGVPFAMEITKTAAKSLEIEALVSICISIDENI
jgi:hypothetical protein